MKKDLVAVIILLVSNILFMIHGFHMSIMGKGILYEIGFLINLMAVIVLLITIFDDIR